MKKCQFYANSQTTCSLMIDDLAPMAVTVDKHYSPANDWGYGLSTKNSLYGYLSATLFQKYPEIRGTFFVASNNNANNPTAGYHILSTELDGNFKDFVQDVSGMFDVGFHGTTHGHFQNINSPEFSGNWIQEFECLTLDDVPRLRHELCRLEDSLGVTLTGGKYPGYKSNHSSPQILDALGFKWWAASVDMIDRRHHLNRHTYFGEQAHILALPTNLSGNSFSAPLTTGSRLPMAWRNIKLRVRHFKQETFLSYLYDNQLPITIQEHFQNQRTDGKRQTPNIYDDMHSLDRIFGLLRGADVWYATCSELAHYLESYDHTEIKPVGNGRYQVIYKGRWGKPLLSVKSKSRYLKDLKTDSILQGTYRQGDWVFFSIEEGLYQEM